MLKRFAPILALVAFCWAVFLLNEVFLRSALDRWGILPRELNGLVGIIFSPVLHVSLGHIAANTLPLTVLGGILCARSAREFWVVTLLGVLFTGALTWLIGRKAYHIGASGLVFCYFGYIASLAWFQRTLVNFAISAVCILFYGGMLRGLLPVSDATSWETHLAGLVSGIGLAFSRPRPVRPSGAPRA